jgi:K+-sensing histidine kinase KdpD
MNLQGTTATATARRRDARVRVVGYDGSAHGRRVVEAAARRAGSDGRLIIVYALAPMRPGAEKQALYVETWQHMIDALGPVVDGVEHEFRVVDEPVAQALIEVATHAHAEAIIIGTRRSPTRLGQRTIRSQLEAGPVPITALFGPVERASHPLAQPFDETHRYGYDSFPASDPPSSWSGADHVVAR